MRIDIVKTKVYPFDELSDEAKQSAIENLYSINVDYDWWECTYEDARMVALTLESFDLDRNRHATGNWQEDAKATANAILENHGKSCETWKDATAFLADYTKLETEYNKASIILPCSEYEEFMESEQHEELCDEFLKTILEDYSIMFQEESEYLQSEEAIVETIELNDYEFTVDGQLY